MNDNHNFPIKVLRERIGAVTMALTQADTELAAVQERRDKTAANLKALQRAVEVLRAARGTGTPEVAYSPADGEQVPGKPITEGKCYRVRQMARPDIHGMEVTAIKYDAINRLWLVGTGTHETYVKTTDLAPLPETRAHPNRTGPTLVVGDEYMLHCPGLTMDGKLVRIESFVGPHRAKVVDATGAWPGTTTTELSNLA